MLNTNDLFLNLSNTYSGIKFFKYDNAVVCKVNDYKFEFCLFSDYPCIRFYSHFCGGFVPIDFTFSFDDIVIILNGISEWPFECSYRVQDIYDFI